MYSAAIRFCIQNIVLYTEFFENGSGFENTQNVVNGSVYARKYLFEYKYAFFYGFELKEYL